VWTFTSGTPVLHDASTSLGTQHLGADFTDFISLRIIIVSLTTSTIIINTRSCLWTFGRLKRTGLNQTVHHWLSIRTFITFTHFASVLVCFEPKFTKHQTPDWRAFITFTNFTPILVCLESVFTKHSTHYWRAFITFTKFIQFIISYT